MSDKKNNLTDGTYIPESMSVEPQACNSCMTYCQTSCETMCQTGCEVNCQATCQKSCQNCQGRCESTCQKICQTNCEKLCQSTCEISCMSTCEKSCQNCEGRCQNACESSCQSSCQKICQTNCERLCQSTCEIGCMSTCERNCQNCEGSCQSSCQRICQENCERLCQDYCEVNCLATCQVSCQNCEGRCEAICQKSCQNCEGRCEAICEKSCQNCLGVTCQTCQDCLGNVCLSACENCLGNCEETCERLCQDYCEVNCLGGCQVSCENCQGVACQTCQCTGQNNQQPVDEHTNLIPAIARVPINLYTIDYVNSNPEKLKVKVDYIRTNCTTEIISESDDVNIFQAKVINNFSFSFSQKSSELLNSFPEYWEACPTFALACVMTYYSQYLISPTWLDFTSALGTNWNSSIKKVENRNTSKPALMYKNFGTDKNEIYEKTSPSINEIKSYIDAAIPVIVCCEDPNHTYDHWVVAFGYINDCNSNDNLYIMDSVNHNTAEIFGTKNSLKTRMTKIGFNNYTIKCIRVLEKNTNPG